jgi:hypothetical protein
MRHVFMVVAVALGGLVGCSASTPDVALVQRATKVEPSSTALAPACRVAEAGQPLPAAVRESSGLAQSRRDPGVFWTHNDAGNEPDLFAVDAEGRFTQRVHVVGAEAADWEDLESGPCDAGACLFVGDIGDNNASRDLITVYRLPEPTPGSREARGADPLHARYPDGPRDAESLFLLPSGELFVVTKGRHGAVGLYRYPAPQRPGQTITLEHVRDLFPAPENQADRVTGATASPDGRWVGIRSYRTLYLYPATELVGGGPVAPAVVDLEPLGEAQGESVTISSDGSVRLSSEAEKKDQVPTWSRIQCSFPAR